MGRGRASTHRRALALPQPVLQSDSLHWTSRTAALGCGSPLIARSRIEQGRRQFGLGASAGDDRRCPARSPASGAPVVAKGDGIPPSRTARQRPWPRLADAVLLVRTLGHGLPRRSTAGAGAGLSQSGRAGWLGTPCLMDHPPGSSGPATDSRSRTGSRGQRRAGTKRRSPGDRCPARAGAEPTCHLWDPCGWVGGAPARASWDARPD